VLARAPASSANLGPGFDALAVALDRYVEVEIEPAATLLVRSEGEGAGTSDDAGHLAARVAIDVVGHDRLAITVRSQIPVGRGLGSSAALAAAAAAAAGAADPLTIATRVDGHPDNAAASVSGGLVAAAMTHGAVRVAPLPLDPALRFVLIVPDRALPTTTARQALPSRVTLEDAAFNLARMGLLLAGLADHRLLSREATEDRLHQDHRAPLFPEAPLLLAAMLDGGALASCWSGAGPSLLGICTVERQADVRAAAEEALRRVGVEGLVLVHQADRRGLVTGEDARTARTPGGGPA
jgi:homoserine kinase